MKKEDYLTTMTGKKNAGLMEKFSGELMIKSFTL